MPRRQVPFAGRYWPESTDHVAVRGKHADEPSDYAGPRALDGAQLVALEALQSLEVVCTRVVALPDHRPLQRPLKTLRLRDNPLLEDVEAMEQWPDLQQLVVTRCPVRALPPLHSLRRLTLAACGMSSLPALPATLEVLEAPDNSIDSVSGIERLPRLGRINLSGNRIAELPAALAEGCPAAFSVDLSRNRLFRDVLERMPRAVRLLTLDDNLLDRVTPELLRLGRLQHVSLRRNRIVHVDERVLSECALRTLNLEGNPLADPVFGGASRQGVLEMQRNPQGHDLLQVIRKAYLTTGAPGPGPQEEASDGLARVQ